MFYSVVLCPKDADGMAINVDQGIRSILILMCSVFFDLFIPILDFVWYMCE